MIYILQEEGTEFVKIGSAVDVDARISQLQCANPRKLITLRKLEGGLSTELFLHKMFSNDSVGGEWFKLNPKMLTVRPPAELGGRKRSPLVVNIKTGKTYTTLCKASKASNIPENFLRDVLNRDGSNGKENKTDYRWNTLDAYSHTNSACVWDA